MLDDLEVLKAYTAANVVIDSFVDQRNPAELNRLLLSIRKERGTLARQVENLLVEALVKQGAAPPWSGGNAAPSTGATQSPQAMNAPGQSAPTGQAPAQATAPQAGQLAVGQRVFCKPAGLTGTVVGFQSGLVGVKYDLGNVKWEQPKDLRPAMPGETTGTQGLPGGDPMAQQQKQQISQSGQASAAPPPQPGSASALVGKALGRELRRDPRGDSANDSEKEIAERTYKKWMRLITKQTTSGDVGGGTAEGGTATDGTTPPADPTPAAADPTPDPPHYTGLYSRDFLPTYWHLFDHVSHKGRSGVVVGSHRGHVLIHHKGSKSHTKVKADEVENHFARNRAARSR